MEKILSPSMMCADFGNLRAEVEALDQGGADMFHMDVMDGEFVPNFALSWQDVAAVRGMTDKPLDVHLMVKNPAIYLPYAFKNKANIVYVHYECGDAERYLCEIRNNGTKAGLAINPGTELSEVEELSPLIDFMLVMRVHPGFAGRPAVPEVEDKLQRLTRTKNNFKIVIDGAVSSEAIMKWSAEGVDGFVLGTSVLFRKDQPYGKIIDQLR